MFIDQEKLEDEAAGQRLSSNYSVDEWELGSQSCLVRGLAHVYVTGSKVKVPLCLLARLLVPDLTSLEGNLARATLPLQRQKSLLLCIQILHMQNVIQIDHNKGRQTCTS